MASESAEKIIAVLETDVAHVLATAGTAFGTAVAALGTDYTKAGLVAAAVAAVHAVFIKFFPQAAPASSGK
jgi:hypothetical protein